MCVCVCTRVCVCVRVCLFDGFQHGLKGTKRTTEDHFQGRSCYLASLWRAHRFEGNTRSESPDVLIESHGGLWLSMVPNGPE